jgi:hypothetical protein
LFLAGCIPARAQTLETNEVPVYLDHWQLAWPLPDTNYYFGVTEVSIWSDYNPLPLVVADVPLPGTNCDLPLQLVAPGTNYIAATQIEYASIYGLLQTWFLPPQITTVTAPGVYLFWQSSTDLVNWSNRMIGVFGVGGDPGYARGAPGGGIGYSTTSWNPLNYTNMEVVSIVTTNTAMPLPRP